MFFSGDGIGIKMLLSFTASLLLLIHFLKVLIPRFFPDRSSARAELRIEKRRLENDSAELDMEQKLHNALHPAIPRVLPETEKAASDPKEEPALWK